MRRWAVGFGYCEEEDGEEERGWADLRVYIEYALLFCGCFVAEKSKSGTIDCRKGWREVVLFVVPTGFLRGCGSS